MSIHTSKYRKLAGLQMTLYCKYIVSFAIYSIYIRSKFLYTFLHNKEVDNMLGGFRIYSKTADYALCGVSNIYVQFHSKKANQKRPNKIFDFRLLLQETCNNTAAAWRDIFYTKKPIKMCHMKGYQSRYNKHFPNIKTPYRGLLFFYSSIITSLNFFCTTYY